MFQEFYGFGRRPFQLTPDAAFYFESNSHRKALSYLSYGLAQAEGFIVITGEVGAGKSTLMAHLKEKLDAQNVTVGQIVTSALDSEELLLLAARSFGLAEVKNKPRALASIEGFLSRTTLDGGRAVLIVDEAQNLSRGALEELRMLSNFQLGGRPLLQTILLGQPELRETLAHDGALEQLRQRVIASHHLEGMQPSEIEPYVLHRLARAGWHGRPTLDSRLWDRLYQATGGIPRKINQLMTRLLLLGMVEEADRLDCAMLEMVLAEMAATEPAADRVPQRTGGPRKEEIQDTATKRPEAFAEAAECDAEPEIDSNLASKMQKPASSNLSTDHLEAIESAFAERDRHLSALREQIERVSSARNRDSATPDDLARRISEVETRLEEQERSLRHVLQMMIEYFENGNAPAQG